MNRRWTGFLLVMVSAAAFGIFPILGRAAYSQGMDAMTIGFLRFGLAAVIMIGRLFFRREPLPRGRSLLALMVMGGVAYVAQSTAYLTALQYASAGLVALLLYLYPAMVAGLSAVFLREKLTRPRLAALGLATLGAALTAGPAGGQIAGVGLALLAAAIYSLYIMLGARVMRQVGALQSSTVIFASAGVVFGVLTLAGGPRWPVTPAGWLVMLAMAVVGTVLPITAFLAGLERVGPTNASLLSTLEPVVTVLLAWLFLSERQPPLALFGGGLILAAVALLTRAERK